MSLIANPNHPGYAGSAGSAVSAPKEMPAIVAVHDRLAYSKARLSGVLSRVRDAADRLFGPTPDQAPTKTGHISSSGYVSGLHTLADDLDAIVNEISDQFNRIERAI